MRIRYEAFRRALDDKKTRRDMLFRRDRPFFVLMSQQFDRDDLDLLCDTATAVRRLDRHRDGREFLQGLLRGLRIMNLFAQPSTRTAESFMAAADKLGANTRLVSDLRTSSFSKGESVEDSVRTLSSFFDTIVTRHPDDDFAMRASWALASSSRPIPLVSGGSGKSQHVTQSLLDIYTLRDAFSKDDELDDKRILIVGDVSRNRAARSLAYLLTKYDVRGVDFVTPPEFSVDEKLLTYLESNGLKVMVHHDLRQVLESEGESFDAIYMTRAQKEYDTGGVPKPGQSRKDLGQDEGFILQPDLKHSIRPDCLIMHPLPRINELPDEWADHPGFVIWRQVRNGMWVRAALFASIHGADLEIRARARRLGLL